MASQQKFSIPKIKAVNCKDHIMKVDIRSRDSILFLEDVKKYVLDVKYIEKIQFVEINMIHNYELLKKYVEKKKTMKARLGGPLKEEIGFYCHTLVDKVAIARNGLKAGSTKFNGLGKSQTGVYLNRFLDVELEFSTGPQTKMVEIFVFKYVAGKSKALMVSVKNDIDPTPNFDSHISSVPPNVSDSLFVKYARSNIFLYEYTEDCEPARYPRQCLPYAILKVDKKFVSAAVRKSDISKVSTFPSYISDKNNKKNHKMSESLSASVDRTSSLSSKKPDASKLSASSTEIVKNFLPKNKSNSDIQEKDLIPKKKSFESSSSGNQVNLSPKKKSLESLSSDNQESSVDKHTVKSAHKRQDPRDKSHLSFPHSFTSTVVEHTKEKSSNSTSSGSSFATKDSASHIPNKSRPLVSCLKSTNKPKEKTKISLSDYKKKKMSQPETPENLKNPNLSCIAGVNSEVQKHKGNSSRQSLGEKISDDPLSSFNQQKLFDISSYSLGLKENSQVGSLSQKKTTDGQENTIVDKSDTVAFPIQDRGSKSYLTNAQNFPSTLEQRKETNFFTVPSAFTDSTSSSSAMKPQELQPGDCLLKTKLSLSESNKHKITLTQSKIIRVDDHGIRCSKQPKVYPSNLNSSFISPSHNSTPSANNGINNKLHTASIPHEDAECILIATQKRLQDNKDPRNSANTTGTEATNTTTCYQSKIPTISQIGLKDYMQALCERRFQPTVTLVDYKHGIKNSYQEKNCIVCQKYITDEVIMKERLRDKSVRRHRHERDVHISSPFESDDMNHDNIFHKFQLKESSNTVDFRRKAISSKNKSRTRLKDPKNSKKQSKHDKHHKEKYVKSKELCKENKDKRISRINRIREVLNSLSGLNRRPDNVATVSLEVGKKKCLQPSSTYLPNSSSSPAPHLKSSIPPPSLPVERLSPADTIPVLTSLHISPLSSPLLSSSPASGLVTPFSSPVPPSSIHQVCSVSQPFNIILSLSSTTSTHPIWQSSSLHVPPSPPFYINSPSAASPVPKLLNNFPLSPDQAPYQSVPPSSQNVISPSLPKQVSLLPTSVSPVPSCQVNSITPLPAVTCLSCTSVTPSYIISSSFSHSSTHQKPLSSAFCLTSSSPPSRVSFPNTLSTPVDSIQSHSLSSNYLSKTFTGQTDPHPSSSQHSLLSSDGHLQVQSSSHSSPVFSSSSLSLPIHHSSFISPKNSSLLSSSHPNQQSSLWANQTSSACNSSNSHPTLLSSYLVSSLSQLKSSPQPVQSLKSSPQPVPSVNLQPSTHLVTSLSKQPSTTHLVTSLSLLPSSTQSVVLESMQPLSSHLEPSLSKQPSTTHFVPSLSKQPSTTHFVPSLSKQPSSKHLDPSLSKQPSTTHFVRSLSKQPSTTHFVPSLSKQPSSTHLDPSLSKQPSSKHLVTSLSRQPSSTQSVLSESMQPLSTHLVSSLSQQPSTTHFVPSLSQQPSTTHLVSSLSKQPLTTHLVSSLSQQPSTTHFVSLSQQPSTTHLVSSLSKQPSTTHLVSSLSKQPSTTHLVSSLSQQPSTTHFVPSLSQQPSTTHLVFSLSKQPSTTHLVSSLSQLKSSQSVPSVFLQPSKHLVTSLSQEPSSTQSVLSESMQPSTTHLVPSLSKQPSTTHFVSSLSLQPSTTHFVPSLSQQPSTTHFVPSLSQQPSTTHLVFSLSKQPSTTHLVSSLSQLKSSQSVPSVFLQPSKHLVTSLSQEPSSTQSVLSESMQPSTTHLVPSLSKQPSTTHFVSSLSKQPLSTHLVSSLSKQPSTTHLVSSLSLQPSTTHFVPSLSQQPSTTHLVPSLSQQPSTTHLVSSLSQLKSSLQSVPSLFMQPSSKHLVTSLSQHPSSLKPVLSESMQPLSTHLVPSLSQQPSSTQSVLSESMQPLSTHLDPSLSKQPSTGHLVPSLSKQPSSTHSVLSESMKPFSSHLVPSLSQQPSTTHLVSLSQQPLSTHLVLSSLQSTITNLLRSLSIQPTTTHLVSSSHHPSSLQYVTSSLSVQPLSSHLVPPLCQKPSVFSSSSMQPSSSQSVPSSLQQSSTDLFLAMQASIKNLFPSLNSLPPTNPVQSLSLQTTSTHLTPLFSSQPISSLTHLPVQQCPPTDPFYKSQTVLPVPFVYSSPIKPSVNPEIPVCSTSQLPSTTVFSSHFMPSASSSFSAILHPSTLSKPTEFHGTLCDSDLTSTIEKNCNTEKTLFFGKNCIEEQRILKSIESNSEANRKDINNLNSDKGTPIYITSSDEEQVECRKEVQSIIQKNPRNIQDLYKLVESIKKYSKSKLSLDMVCSKYQDKKKSSNLEESAHSHLMDISLSSKKLRDNLHTNEMDYSKYRCPSPPVIISIQPPAANSHQSPATQSISSHSTSTTLNNKIAELSEAPLEALHLAKETILKEIDLLDSGDLEVETGKRKVEDLKIDSEICIISSSSESNLDNKQVCKKRKLSSSVDLINKSSKRSVKGKDNTLISQRLKFCAIDAEQNEKKLSLIINNSDFDSTTTLDDLKKIPDPKKSTSKFSMHITNQKQHLETKINHMDFSASILEHEKFSYTKQTCVKELNSEPKKDDSPHIQKAKYKPMKGVFKANCKETNRNIPSTYNLSYSKSDKRWQENGKISDRTLYPESRTNNIPSKPYLTSNCNMSGKRHGDNGKLSDSTSSRSDGRENKHSKPRSRSKNCKIQDERQNELSDSTSYTSYSDRSDYRGNKYDRSKLLSRSNIRGKRLYENSQSSDSDSYTTSTSSDSSSSQTRSRSSFAYRSGRKYRSLMRNTSGDSSYYNNRHCRKKEKSISPFNKRQENSNYMSKSDGIRDDKTLGVKPKTSFDELWNIYSQQSKEILPVASLAKSTSDPKYDLDFYIVRKGLKKANSGLKQVMSVKMFIFLQIGYLFSEQSAFTLPHPVEIILGSNIEQQIQIAKETLQACATHFKLPFLNRNVVFDIPHYVSDIRYVENFSVHQFHIELKIIAQCHSILLLKKEDGTSPGDTLENILQRHEQKNNEIINLKKEKQVLEDKLKETSSLNKEILNEQLLTLQTQLCKTHSELEDAQNMLTNVLKLIGLDTFPNLSNISLLEFNFQSPDFDLMKSHIENIKTSFEIVTKNFIQTFQSQNLGHAHYLIPEQLLLKEEKGRLYSKGGCFMILSSPITYQNFEVLFHLRLQLEDLQKCLDVSSAEKLASLTEQRDKLLNTFVGKNSTKKKNQIEVLSSKFLIVKNCIKKIIGEDGLNKLPLFLSLITSVEQHLKIVTQELKSNKKFLN